MKKSFISLCCLLISLSSLSTWAAGGGHSIGGNIIFASPGQDDINTLISRANERVGGVSTSPMGTGYEFNLVYGYRWGLFGFQFRPSFFTQSTTGTGGGGNYDYSLTGMTVFPMMKIYALENSFIKLSFHMGLGYGHLFGTIKEDSAEVKFNSGAFGFATGVAVDFCFTANHCMNLEGTFRYMPFPRNISTSVSGTFATGSNASLSQPTAATGAGLEVELDNRDLGTTMSGMLSTIGYTYYF